MQIPCIPVLPDLPGFPGFEGPGYPRGPRRPLVRSWYLSKCRQRKGRDHAIKRVEVKSCRVSNEIGKPGRNANHAKLSIEWQKEAIMFFLEIQDKDEDSWNTIARIKMKWKGEKVSYLSTQSTSAFAFFFFWFTINKKKQQFYKKG